MLSLSETSVMLISYQLKAFKRLRDNPHSAKTEDDHLVDIMWEERDTNQRGVITLNEHYDGPKVTSDRPTLDAREKDIVRGLETALRNSGLLDWNEQDWAISRAAEDIYWDVFSKLCRPSLGICSSTMPEHQSSSPRQ